MLLIVESPEIARRIDRLNIPYLTVFSTNGFLWWPRLKPGTQTLTLKARQEHNGVEQRKKLKELSKYAVKIICATDFDPAGTFISWSIERYLKRSCIHHPLTDLSKSGVLNLIRKAVVTNRSERIEPTVIHGLLLLREIDQTQHQKLLQSLFKDIIHYPDNYLSPVYENDFLSVAQHILKEKCVTLPKLIQDVQAVLHIPPKTIYNEVWELFLHQESLITYPRTIDRGFYSSTWEQFPSFSELNNAHLCLSDLRPEPSTLSAHESMRVTDLSVAPDETRKWLNKTQRFIYRYLWEQTQSVIYPDLKEIEHQWKKDTLEKTSNSRSHLRSVSVSAIYESASRFGLIRNSNIYATLSYLHQEINKDPYSDEPHAEHSKHDLFTELYEWLKQPTEHPRKKTNLRRISKQILT